MNCIIYDFETLSREPREGVVLSLAVLKFDETKYLNAPYDYMELVDSCLYLKFDVTSQVKKYGRKIDKDTLKWWESQGPSAKAVLKPSQDDLQITELYDRMLTYIGTNVDKVYTRGNTFDPMFLDSLLRDTGKPELYNWHAIRDTRSMIEGMSFGMLLKNNYIPSSLQGRFVPHDARHDIAMDVMRMQYLAQAILNDEN